ncbi:MAG: nucleotidyltransferase family protein [bacterium]
MSKLDEIIKRKNDREKKLKESLASIKEQLIKHGAIKIILFGSLAYRKVDVNSDLDLFVIMPSVKSSKEWMKFIYDNIEFGISSDIIVYNEEEFKENLPVSRFIRNILESGKVIYEKSKSGGS